MINIRKSSFFMGMFIVSTLILLNSCEKCGKKDDKNTKLKTETQQLVDKLSNKLNLKEEQKKKLESEMVEDLPSEVNIKTWLVEFQSLQAKLKVTGGGTPLSDVNDGIKRVIPGSRDVNLLEASEVVDILIDLLKNAQERAKLKG